MNRDEAQKYLPIVAALAEGKEIQWKTNDGRWLRSDDIVFGTGYEYRIKTEPVWRPWTIDEVPVIFMARAKDGGVTTGIWTARDLRSNSLSMMLENYEHVHEDGTTTPCGVLEVQP